jgi:hypothetical protein
MDAGAEDVAPTVAVRLALTLGVAALDSTEGDPDPSEEPDDPDELPKVASTVDAEGDSSTLPPPSGSRSPGKTSFSLRPNVQATPALAVARMRAQVR